MALHHPKNFFCGLSGIELPFPKYQFPPPYQNSSRLTYYATFFNSLEINSSFYKIPMRATVSRWAASVPGDFKFTFKLFREITHARDLDFDEAIIDEFIKKISNIDGKRGCLLVQLPPGLKQTSIHQLDYLLRAIHSADPLNLWKVAVEFRYSGWYHDDVFELLQSHGATLVIHDMPRSATPLNKVVSDIVYVRFHGPTGNYRGSYPEAFLHEYCEYIREWLSDGKSVYVYFNNTGGDAFNNLATLKSLLA